VLKAVRGTANHAREHPQTTFDAAFGRVESIREAERGPKKFAQFSRKSACAVPDRPADRRRVASAATAAEQPFRHPRSASMRYGTVRDAQMLRAKNAFIYALCKNTSRACDALEAVRLRRAGTRVGTRRGTAGKRAQKKFARDC